jgi:hypothetical protein
VAGWARLIVVLALLFASAGCHRTVPFDTQLAAEELASEGKPTKPPVPDSLASLPASSRDTLAITKDTVNAPSTQTAKMKEEADKLAKDKAKSKADLKALAKKAGGAAKKLKGKSFLGKKIKKGYARSGSGKGAIIEKFHYLARYEAPDPYAPAKYYYHKKRRKIFKTSVIDPNVSLILHGPYEKRQGAVVLESGYFFMGTKHLRWERYAVKDHILLSKYHWEKGFLRDSRITYYPNSRSKIKEVLPYYNGQLEGDYVSFLPNGQLDWTGQFQGGRHVGLWTQYWGFRNRRHYQWQYPKSEFEPETEPELLREYNRNGTLIYEKGKVDKREQNAQQEARIKPKRTPAKKAEPKTTTFDESPEDDEDGESTADEVTEETKAAPTRTAKANPGKPTGKMAPKTPSKTPAAKTPSDTPAKVPVTTPATTSAVDSTAKTAAPDPSRPPTKEEARERARRGMSKPKK